MDSKPAAASPSLVDLIVRAPAVWGGILLTLAGLLIGGAVAFGLAARPDAASVAAEEARVKAEADAAALDPQNKAKPKDTPDGGNLLGLRSVPAGGMVWCLGSALLFAIGGGLALSRAKAETPTPTLARQWIVVFGGTFGLLTSVYGLFLMSQHLAGVTKSIEEKDIREAGSLLQGLAVLFLGLVATFLSLQPARQDERNQASLRRLIHGYNSALNGVLLLLILVGINVGAYIYLPQKLDTTENSFYTLSDSSKKLLRDLTSPVRAYLITPSSETTAFDADIRTLLERCADESSQFRFKVFSAGVDGKAINEVAARLKAQGLIKNRVGILLAFGEDEKQTAFISYQDIVVESRNPQGGDAFQGEAKLMTEVGFFASNQARSPVVYFVQGHGEIDMTDGRPGEQNPRTGRLLKKMLTESRFDVRTANFAPGAPAEPIEDADVVVVLSPHATMSAAGVAAMEKYMNPGADKKPGRMLLFLPAWKEPRSDAVGPTGLDGFLARYGMKMKDTLTVSAPGMVRGVSDPLMIPFQGGVPPSDSLSPVLNDRDFLGYHIRGIEPLNAPQGPIKNRPFLITLQNLPVWEEPNFGTNPEATFKRFQVDAKLRQEKKVGSTRLIGMLVTESSAPAPPGAPPTPPAPGADAPRMVVMGTGDCFSDAFLTDRDNKIDPTQYTALFKGLLDWVRDKPNLIGVNPKEYKTFSLPKSSSTARVIWIPMVLICLSSVVMGIGVWVLRRK